MAEVLREIRASRVGELRRACFRRGPRGAGRAYLGATLARLFVVCLLGLTFARPVTAQRGALHGIVFDSLARAPLVGATVQLVAVGAERSFATTTDTAGRYAFTGLPRGVYLAGFFHLAADTLGIESHPRRVDVQDDAHDLPLGVPSARTLRDTMCPRAAASDSAALLLGHVRDAGTDAPLPQATVAAEWLETIVARGTQSHERIETAVTSARGFFAVCGLPSEMTLLARVSHDSVASGYVEIEIPVSGLRHVTLYAGRRAPSPVVTDSASGGQTFVRGTARLSGRVLDANFDPLANAQASIWGSDVQGLTNDRGVFVIDSLPAGTYTLEIKALGYIPVRQTVDLFPERQASVVVDLPDKAYLLPTNVVRGDLVYSRVLEGFERRRRSAVSGAFLTSRDIARQPYARLATLLGQMQGINVERRNGRVVLTMRGANAMTVCVPSVYVDGVIDRSGDYDKFASAEIAALEVYAREAQRPFEFSDRNRCGSVAIWTRPRQD